MPSKKPYDKKEEKKAHSQLGASICERWMECPGSVALSATVPQRKPGTAASEGTVAHSICDGLLKERIGQGKFQIPKFGEADGRRIEVTSQMVDFCKIYVDYVMGLAAKYGVPNSMVMTETKVKIPADGVTEDLWGTADAIVIALFQRIIVIDFKYGANIKVDAEDNPQLMFYGLGGYFSLPESQRDEISVVQVVIVQPRISNSIESVEIPIEKLLEFHKELIAAAARTKTETYVFKAGSYCQWCPAALICPANQKQLGEIAKLEFADIQPETQLPDIKRFTDEQLARLLNLRPAFKNFLDLALTEAKERAAKNKSCIAGWGYVEALTNRVIAQKDRLVEELYPKFGDAIYEDRKLKTPNKLAELFDTEEEQKKLERNHVVRYPAGFTFKKLAKGRVGADISGRADFEDFVYEESEDYFQT